MNINELHEKFSQYGKNAKEWLRKCALLLPEIEKYQVWKQKGFHSIYEYSYKLASMSKGQVDDALRILKKVENMPALMKVVEIKGINSVRPVTTIVTKETQTYWAKQALKMSKHELETFVREMRIDQANNSKGTAGIYNQNEIRSPQVMIKTSALSQKNGKNLESLSMALSPEIAAKLKKMNNGDWNELMEKFIELYEKDLQEKLIIAKSAVKKTASRHIPIKIKKYILKRSNGKCEFPNCNKKINHLHHTDRFATNHEHDPEKIIVLCQSHHDLAHRGLVHNEEKDPKFWRIRQEPDYKNLNRFIDQQVEFYRRS